MGYCRGRHDRSLHPTTADASMSRRARLVLLFQLTCVHATTAQLPARRQPVTPELERTAFADERARNLLHSARAARLAQDSALRAYDAKTFVRMSVGMGFRRIGRDRLLLRTEQSSRVRWQRGSGLWVEPTGRRTGFPMGAAQLDLTEATPIPFFPGRESLWIPSSNMGVAQPEVNENDMLHPLAAGAEAYYRYATGDSVAIRLPDGRAIALRELRITARRPDWRAFVGSFWFDVESGHLVRAAYRMAVEMDIWQAAAEDSRREREMWEERARTDTGEAGRSAKARAERARDDEPPALVRGIMSPMRANISAVTVEYGLHEGRFWLPKHNVAEGYVQAGFVRMPVKVEESFRYTSVNGTEPVPPIPAPVSPDDTTWASSGNVNIGVGAGGGGRRAAADTSAAARAAREDSLINGYTRTADSLRAAAQAARAKGDTTDARELEQRAAYRVSLARQILRRREGCARDSSYYAGTSSRFGGAVRMAIRMPCDLSRLANSPDLPGSIYDPGEEIFGTSDRDALLETLNLGLQPGWAPQKPVLHTGLDLIRYNRIEALSVGASATSALGKGYTARLVGRLGTGDWVPNGELSLSRSNGRTERRLGTFHRLAIANDDWGAPLSLGASLANLLYARDEGFYYRSWGAELVSTRETTAPLEGADVRWRLFAERHRSAGVSPNTQISFGDLFGDPRFLDNIDASTLTALGAGADVRRTFGADPLGSRFDARLRSEAAFTDRDDSLGSTGYGRVMVEGTIVRPLRRFTIAVTGAAGASAGDLPPQRLFYVGGLQTVRGQFARSEGAGRVGDAFWLGRGELGLGRVLAARPALFYDIGWAGARADFTRPGRPMSGAGIGLSLLDGLMRIDVSRGIWPETRWRADFYLEARF